MTPTCGALVLLRHGESTANAAGVFTGITDAPLTERGRTEAERAALLIRDAGLLPDDLIVSTMRRTRETAEVMLPLLKPARPHVTFDWHLDERNYGALTGQSKAAVRAEYGEELFVTWRRSVDIAPPPMSPARQARLAKDRPEALRLGLTESLRDVIHRVSRCWHERILPCLEPDRTMLVIAHGNSLRALCAVIEDLDEASLRALNIPTGHPLVYRFGGQDRPTYLDATAADAAALALAREGGT